ncbi:hypothetical protein SEPB56_02582 [Salmonella enterica subsp. enterica serovar Paratyphi B str. SARA56]|nr:hypothetical protein SEPB56_02582 [Salmonella enterica subsp. enterica serovar Paratyphi B str. SARA56]
MEAVVRFGVEAEEERLVFEVFFTFFLLVLLIFSLCFSFYLPFS